MSKKGIAKALAWIAGAVATLAASGAFGKYSAAIATLAPLASAASVHIASETSAGHPNGSL